MRALPADWPPVPLALANPVEGDFRNPGGIVLGVRARETDVPWLRPAFYGMWTPSSLEDTRLGPRETRTATCRFPGDGTDTPPVVEVHVVHRRGDLGAGVAEAPFPLRPNDAPPAVRWMRVVR